MINRKLSKTLGSALGIMGFILAIGIIETPASAEDNVQSISTYTNISTSATTGTAVSIKDYSLNINKVETQNGIKVTVDKALASKKNLKVTLKIESDKPLDKIDYDNSILELTYENYDDFGATNSRTQYIDDKTILVTLEKNNYKGEFPAKGDMRVDLVFSKYKVNMGIDIPVDFTECFKYTFDKDISGKIPELDTTFTKLESDVMGTRVISTSPKSNMSDKSKSAALANSSIILKVGDRMYKTHVRGDYSDDSKLRIRNYETSLLTYDMVKNEKNISIIPVICNLTPDQLDAIYSKDTVKEITPGKDVLNNINYDKTFDFANGSKGEIYNIERNDNTVKVYCKGPSEKESLLMASNLRLSYHYDKDIDKENRDYVFYDNNSVSFYKDPKEALGYIVEFNNVEKSKNAELHFNKLIKQADNYNLADEIKLGN
jgi:hypothetical protein